MEVYLEHARALDDVRGGLVTCYQSESVLLERASYFQNLSWLAGRVSHRRHRDKCIRRVEGREKE